MSISPLGIGLYGANGHQIQAALAAHPHARLAAIAAFPRASLPPALRDDPAVAEYATLDDLLRDPRVELVSLCSPRRADQAGDAIRALRAGKHVYAEKPAALDEASLDAVLEAARANGRHFREMAGTAFLQPYLAMREVVRSGRIGPVVQVIAEKSYPYHDRRPHDEEVDGGLIAQCGVHALRMIEQVAGRRVEAVRAVETCRGNRAGGREGLRMAAALLLRLEEGAVGAVSANYLNPPGTGVWGYESLRILGEQGFVESLEGGARTRLVVDERDCGPLDVSAPEIDYLDAYLALLQGRGDLPVTLEEELSPTRWVLRARRQAREIL